ncbi:unnamed protein product [Arctia plantaginis]|uniref:Uncharacterized protein n=1 Tax=Arctia plantaginis TaxID=874455 RepID=A0A8S1AL23_ARCPL|nr:unnamed protein product [Arctia plantaginis]CAB3245402.1 unnamed protein product [Arctia plantaginis]
MAGASRRSLGQLLQQGWNEIPEVIGSTGMAIVGIGFATVGCYNYVKQDGDNRRYKSTYTIMRPDDPKVKLIRKD